MGTLDLSDPLVIAALAGGVAFLLIVILLIAVIRMARRSADATAPLANHLGMLTDTVRGLDRARPGRTRGIGQ